LNLEKIAFLELLEEILPILGSKFAAIKPIDESWAIDIAKNKRFIGEEPSRSSVHKEYIEIDDLFNEIGSVEGSKFAAIKPIDESWAIDIAKNKRLIGEEPSRSSVHVKRNKLHIEETSSSDIRQSMSMRSMSLKIDYLKEDLQKFLHE
nr:hypothetical protein [Tanacetum cinerariifolium]